MPFGAPMSGWGEPQQPRRRGLLTRTTPLAPLTETPFAPVTVPDQLRQPIAPPAFKPPSLMQRLGEGVRQIDPQTWFQIAGGFLDRAEGDATWGQALGGVGTALEGQQDRALRKEDVEYTRGQRTRETDERTRMQSEYQRILDDPSVPPDLKAAVRAAGPSQIGALLGTQVMSAGDKAQLDMERERAKVSDQQWAASHALDRQQVGLAAQRLATDRFSNSQLAALGREEAGYITGLRSKLDTGREVMRNVNELQAILNRSPDIFGALLESDQEAAIRKFGRGDPQKIADIQRVYSINTEIARDELRGQTPISNLDFLSQMRAGPGTQNMGQAVQAWINRANAEYSGAQDRFNSGYEYMQNHGSLYTPDPTTGKNWYQGAYGNVVQAPASPPPPPAPPVRPRADASNKGRIWVEDDGSEWRSDGRGWIRQRGPGGRQQQVGPGRPGTVPVRPGGF